jgi:hypothetical protein
VSYDEPTVYVCDVPTGKEPKVEPVQVVPVRVPGLILTKIEVYISTEKYL